MGISPDLFSVEDQASSDKLRKSESAYVWKFLLKKSSIHSCWQGELDPPHQFLSLDIPLAKGRGMGKKTIVDYIYPGLWGGNNFFNHIDLPYFSIQL